ncbi:MAG: type ISP restriction/modification enzyme, partial [Bryobacteraceae bacterium]
TKLYDMYARFFRWASDRIAENGVVAFVSNRSYIDSRTFDGFRDVVTREFNEIHIVDLGGDVRANPKLSGTKHNVFGIQTGVAIGFLVKRAKARGCRIFHSRRPEFETAEEKLAWLSKARLGELEHSEISPDAKHNWLNLTDNDFDTLIPVATKATKQATNPKAIFRQHTNGTNTARDEWVYDLNEISLLEKVSYLVEAFNADHAAIRATGKFERNRLSKAIKWSEGLIANVQRAAAQPATPENVTRAMYRPFYRTDFYWDLVFSDRLTSRHEEIFGEAGKSEAWTIAISAPGPSSTFRVLATKHPADWHFMGDTQLYPLRMNFGGTIATDNITNWALKQFKDHYKNAVTPAKAGVQSVSKTAEAKALGPGLHRDDERVEPGLRRDDERVESGLRRDDEQVREPPASGKRAIRKSAITKDAIFHYVYAVLHDPAYREKYAQNLKREFPRIPFYPDFWRWAEWGRELMELHIGYESVEPWPLKRTDIPDEKARKNGAAPKALLRADKDGGRIQLDSETTLTGVPPEAWEHKLGNRSALEWILDQYKEKKPKDPTIRERFNTYRFADYKDKVIDLLARVTRVSVETRRIVEAMRATSRTP